MRKVTEQEERTIHNPLPQFKMRKKFPLFDCESKNSSRTASTQGSDPLTRKEFLDSVHSSKGSLGSSDGSEPSSSTRNTREEPVEEDLCNGDRLEKNRDEVCRSTYSNLI